MKKAWIFLFIALVSLSTHAKIRKVVVNPAGGGNDFGAHSRLFVEKEISLRFAKKIQSLNKKNRIDTTLTRFEDYPVHANDRIALVNQETDAIWISVHFSKAFGPNQITLYTLGDIPSSSIESNYLIPIEKAHRPWISRSTLLADEIIQTLSPELDPKHITLSTPVESLYGINHPAVMIDCQLSDTALTPQGVENLIDDLAERISIATKTFIRKEKKL
ncbi:MAG: N-acetylmuramoyl-L-alanine amidase [Bdellovibrionales bacterium]|nr:N-acetylmuramoyl-L-alanine amidase [Bdellovibrionales bacterium]